MFLFYRVSIQDGQRAFAVLAQCYLFSVFFEHEGIVVGPDVHDRYLEQFAFDDGRAGLSHDQVFAVLAHLYDVEPGADHFQAPEFELALAAFAQFGHLVKDQLSGHFVVFYPYVLYVAYDTSPLVHIQQHGVAHILLHVHTGRQYPGAIAVQAVVRYTHSFSH